MLKGVNRSIIEVKDTENPIFEKVICFVRLEYCSHGYTNLKTTAEKYVKTLMECESERSRKLPVILRISVPIVTAAMGFAVGLLIN